MCGFAGFLGGANILAAEWPWVLTGMGDALAHRGPDDAGVWTDPDAGIGLIHRRLSILDLSPAGHQPMVSHSGRYVIAFNGEIYNHLELRKYLLDRNVPWRGHSDTETLLAGFDAWGIEATIKQAVGMFAFAVWDRQSHALTMARDRLGEKPLYYGWQGEGQERTFLFGSELKALKAHPRFSGEINRNSIYLQLRHNCIPAPHSVYQGISKLLPGHLLTVPTNARPGAHLQVNAYWPLKDAVLDGKANGFKGDKKEAIAALDAILRQAVAGQMLADVPLGAFLSGGVDSSTIVALMQVQSARPVKTFSIGFSEAGYDEAIYARAVARHLGTEHTELYVSAHQAMEVIPRLPTLYDEPFSDSSQIPTFLVSQLAKKHVTVALSGDAGDELFGGYSRYFRADQTWRYLARMPWHARHWLAESIMATPVVTWNRLTAPIAPLFPTRMRNLGDKAHKLASLLNHKDERGFYQRFTIHWEDAADIVLGIHDNFPRDPSLALGTEGFFETMMATDTLNYLPDDILVKVDRAAMGVSLETRVPLLDHRVVEFAWRLPLHLKIHNGQGKWILRQLLYRYVPKQLIDRPKAGFSVPIDSWLRGPLRDWAEALLDETRLKQEGFFNPTPIRQKWNEHLSGQRNWQYHLWDVLMFQAWLEQERRH